MSPLEKIVVELMLGFDLSVIDIVLVIAVVVLILLFISQRQGKQAEPDSKKNRRLNAKDARAVRVVEERAPAKSSLENRVCFHHFGYLRNHPRSTPIPDECFGCQKVMSCLAPEEQS